VGATLKVTEKIGKPAQTPITGAKKKPDFSWEEFAKTASWTVEFKGAKEVTEALSPEASLRISAIEYERQRALYLMGDEMDAPALKPAVTVDPIGKMFKKVVERELRGATLSSEREQLRGSKVVASGAITDPDGHYLVEDEMDSPALQPSVTVDPIGDVFKKVVTENIRRATLESEQKQLRDSEVLPDGRKPDLRKALGDDSWLNKTSEFTKGVVKGAPLLLIPGSSGSPSMAAKKFHKGKLPSAASTAFSYTVMDGQKGPLPKGPGAPEIKEGKDRGSVYLVEDEMDGAALQPGVTADGKSRKAGNTAKVSKITTEQLRVRYAKQLELKKGEDSWQNIARVHKALQKAGAKDPEIAAKLASLNMLPEVIKSQAKKEKENEKSKKK